jgi:hypothetical protein
MSQQISIPDELYRHLVEEAERTRTPVGTLITHLLEKTMSPLHDTDLIDQITRAYATGSEPPSAGTWSQVEAELAATSSPFESLEAAMKYARGRS